MSDPNDHESRLREFELAWQTGHPPPIDDFLPTHAAEGGVASPPDRDLLVELVCIDLEYCWKASRCTDNKGGGDRPRMVSGRHLDDYVGEFARLGPLDELPIHLIAEEYRARRLWGDAPTHSVCLERFGSRHDAIRAALVAVDHELEIELDDARPTGNAASHTKSVDPEAPHPFSDYRLLRQIGMGAVGKVYEARQQSLDRLVAVKYLRKSFIGQDRTVKRFVAEARVVARLSHPGIVGVHGLGRTPNGGYFIVMDLVDGSDLDTRCGSDRVSTDDAVGWVIQACAAISHAHAHGIAHCDLKPSNLLLDQDGRIFVTDFGLARDFSDQSIPSAEVAGTAPYMAPEQISRYWGSISEKTDVYGLGALLYTLLSGSPPYVGPRIADVLTKVVSAEGPRSLGDGLGLPRELVDICDRCLAKQPAERFDSARDLADALRQVTTDS